mgnify:CR=1 FL=1
MNEELSHTEDMTIEDFLSGATAYEIADKGSCQAENRFWNNGK